MSIRFVYKYQLAPVQFHGILRWPKTGVIRKVGMQDSRLTFWVEISKDNESEVAHEVTIVGTGNPIPQDGLWVYCETFFDGPFVWHVYAKRL